QFSSFPLAWSLPPAFTSSIPSRPSPRSARQELLAAGAWGAWVSGLLGADGVAAVAAVARPPAVSLGDLSKLCASPGATPP
ncbi:unnamed protein product, partial [Urochloa humidicola]